MLVIPGIGLLALFLILPGLAAPVLTVFDSDPLAGTVEFVGFDNYSRVLRSGELLDGIRITLIYALMTVPTTIVLGLLVAFGIHHVGRGATFYRLIYFLPVASTLAAMSVTWRWMFYPRSGVIDRTLGPILGLENWLSSPDLALPAVAVVGVWQGVGFVVIIYLAGLVGVSPVLLEAARIDGANAWQRFVHVTWPSLGPTTLFAVLITTISSLRVFDTVKIMTDGGPLGSTQTLAFLVWRRGINYLEIGPASVINVVMIAMIIVLTAVHMRTYGNRIEEAGSR